MKLRPGAMPHLRTPFAWRGGRVLQLLGGLLLALGLAACSEAEAPLEKQKVHPVKLLSLSDEGGGVIQRYPGVVEASERSNLSFRIGGELRELKVQAGQEVEKGELIARLDDRDARSELNNARSSFNLAQATYKRMKYSVEKGAISRARFDEAQAEFQSAQAQYSRAQDQLSYTYLKAPYDGVIARVPVDNYQVVAAQETIAVLQQPGQIDVIFNMPERQVRAIDRERAAAGRLEDAALAWVRFGSGETRYPARYKEHDTSASEGSLSYEVTLTLPEPQDITVLSGMSATVELDMQQLTAATQGQWRVPIEAVVAQEESPDQPVVWRYVPKGGDAQASASINTDATTDTGSDDGRNEGKSEGKQQEVSAQGTVEAVPVTVLQATGEGLVITGELSAGDRLVTAGASRMEAGEPVRPWVKEAGL
ncbi:MULTISPECIES: efflux RND transporter periplasmic adaptor subunit [Cobetia]|uniref:efflux RND transporter periplasmic adaptor subunit n=1 Tax=Cobetia TaxID=204286 RepID=UPI0020C74191|nr:MULTISPECIES: efflux RND transporter periplasmic adaptor subunit [Cobetia]MDI4659702.1 efflux RND transporter periplasmic adaptor subunit [Cobetia sp. BMC6]